VRSLGAIVELRRGAGDGGLRPLGPAGALVALAEQWPQRRAQGAAGFERLARLVRTVPAYSLSVGDLDRGAERLGALVEGRA
jgi:hypothetical protein